MFTIYSHFLSDHISTINIDSAQLISILGVAIIYYDRPSCHFVMIKVSSCCICLSDPISTMICLTCQVLFCQDCHQRWNKEKCPHCQGHNTVKKFKHSEALESRLPIVCSVHRSDPFFCETCCCLLCPGCNFNDKLHDRHQIISIDVENWIRMMLMRRMMSGDNVSAIKEILKRLPSSDTREITRYLQTNKG